MDSILFYQPASGPTSYTKGRFQASTRLARTSVTENAMPRTKIKAKPRDSSTPFSRLSQSETNTMNMAKSESRSSVIQPSPVSSACDLGLSFSTRDNAIAGRDYDELPYLYDLLKAYEHLRKCSECAAIASHDDPEDARTKLIIARKLHNERLPQGSSLASALVNQKRTGKSEEVIRPGDSQENPIIFSDDDDDDDDTDKDDDEDTNKDEDKVADKDEDADDDDDDDHEDDRNDDEFDDGSNSDGSTKENSLKTISDSLNPRREDIPQTIQKDVGEEAKQSLSGTSVEIISINAGQELKAEIAELYAAL